MMRLDGNSLRAFYANALISSGVPPEYARTTADGIYYADLNGLDSHGAAGFLRIYLPMHESAQLEANAAPEITVDQAACATVDARGGFGFVAGTFAMSEAIRRAGMYGIGAVGVHNSTHAGAMGFYTHQAVYSGMLAMAFTNLGSQGLLPPPGGRVPLLGTNALAVSAPAQSEATFCLDMSTTVVSAGRVRLAARRGQVVPEGWLVGAQGEHVRDPEQLDEGHAQLRFLGGAVETGAHKGLGLAMLADILCGLLTGADVGPTPDKLCISRAAASRNRPNIGHFFIAIRINAFRGEAQFGRELDAMLRTIRKCPPVSPDTQVTYPGMPESSMALARARDGIPLEPALYDQMQTIAARLGVAPPVTLC